MKKWLKKILVGIPIFVVSAYAVMAVVFSGPVTDKELEEKFIVANPLNLSQVRGFSKYRSCAGHDYRGPMAKTGKKEPMLSSLKHYVMVKPEFRGKNDTVYAIAPFDGVIHGVYDDMGGPGDQQIWLTPESRSPRQWQFIFFHIALDPGMKKGSVVKAGQRIGRANLTRGPDGATDNFDFALKFTRPLHRPAVDAPFAHMSPDVLAQYAAVGVTETNVTVPKQERMARPCAVVENGGDGPDLYFRSPWSPDDYMLLR